MANLSTGALIDEVQTKTGLSKKEARTVVETVLEELSSRLAAGERVQLAGFGSFEVRARAQRQGINPKTREPITIPASKVVGFKPAAQLRGRLGTSEPTEQTVGG